MEFTFELLFTAVLMLSIIGDVLSFKPIFLCDERRGMTAEQVKLCYKYKNHMGYVIDAREIAKTECERQFAGRRWNCTFPPASLVDPLIKPKMKLPTREAAFVSALASASIMHTVSRACMENKLPNYCGCSQENRPPDLEKEKLWRGCGDNLPYGYRFSKMFVDSSESWQLEDHRLFSRVLMNLHNNEVGRWAVFKESRVMCRCHGVTKNCATKMCYRQLADFKKVGHLLQERHQSSIQVKLMRNKGEVDKTGEKTNMQMKLVEQNPEYNKYSPQQLVYLQDSPSYCERNEQYDIFGTKGRKCQKNPQSLNDCSVLCCGRGHHTRREIIKEKCGCKFIWCCEVRCHTCEKEQNVRYCK